jgi:ATP-binding cassette subfamily B (MDR/TAP) protein 1
MPPITSCFNRVEPDALYFLIIAGAAMVASFLELFCWTLTAQRQTHRIRAKFFAAVLNQHIGWFDANQAGQMTSRLAE